MEEREAISQYKEWYKAKYGFGPTEKLIDMFCKIKDIDIEKLNEQAREEVVKVEERDEVIMKHSELPWKFNGNEIVSLKDEKCGIAGAINIKDMEFIVEACNNYEALETNYQNLLGKYEEACSIRKMKDKENDALTARVNVLLAMIDEIIKLLIEPFKGQLHSSILIKLEEIKRHLEVFRNGNNSCSKSTQ